MAEKLPAVSGSAEDETILLAKLRNLSDQKVNVILTKNLTFLCERLQTKELLKKMKEQEAIRTVPMSIIEAHTISYDQNGALIDFLEKAGTDKFVNFIDALLATDQKAIALQLAKSLSH